MYHKLFISISMLSFAMLFQGCGGGSGSSGGGTQDPVTFTAYTDLSWISPKTRTDGSYLLSTSIAGYKVYYGDDNANLKLLVDIQGTGIDEYRIGVPTAGSYFFAIAAYDTQGIEGELSNIELKEAISFDD
ncbi:hypothetical protein [Candidatus Thiodiazotropha sp. LNASS1]|uniref:hypothetical protein n=1 Tax=Candidatus Thiodiazotropha sp. LNASS1 TaxID=3096260 RepID=UPI00348C8441